ncbi:histone-lysine N-methyltransferase SETMAR [Trichonephila clavipes]|nr:histone-lysine N-methyltransferase SETMAR [Trichonephila clavipes]
MYYKNTSREGGWSAPEASVGLVPRRTLNNKGASLYSWDCRGIISKEYLKSGQTVDSTIYSEMLIEISDAIREKCKKEFRRKVVLYHHDNARPHVSAMTSWTLYTLGRLHPEGTIFHSNDKVINKVNRFLESCTPESFIGGIEKLSKRWQTIVDLNGDPYPLISAADFFHAEIVEVEIGGVAIYRRSKSYCNLYGAQGQRQAYF